MKILYVASEWVPFSWPNKSPGGGGVSTLEPIIIEALRSEHDIDFLVPSDSFVDSSVKDDVIVGDFPSKKISFSGRALARTRNLLAVAQKYDRIFWNDSRFSVKFIEDLKKIAPKICAINHSHPEGYIGAFNVYQYHLHWVLAQHGAVVAHVQPDLDAFLASHMNAIKRNPYLIPGEGCGVFGEKFRYIDMLVTDPESLEGDLTNEKLWVAIGRGSKDKKIKFALESWIAAKVPGRLSILVQDPQQKDNEIPEILQITNSRDDVEVIIDAPRDVVFDRLRRAKGCIFPSTRESMGLVPFEANCCGVPVVYTIEQSHRFLEPIGFNIRVSRRTLKSYAEAIRKVDTVTFDKEKIRERVAGLFPASRIKTNVLSLLN
jgi:glycosyltransferase involved in cell wall biosynthesis